jgi:hypothetical protein
VSAAEPSQAYWRLCAQSDAVVLGTLTVPRDSGGRIAGKDDYARIEFHPTQIMKGKLTPEPFVRYYLGVAPHEVEQKTLLALNGKPVIAFLILAADDRSNPALYFAQNVHGVEAAVPQRVKEIGAEIDRQKDVLAHWKSDPSVSHFAAAKVLIDKTTVRSSTTQAFKDIEALGHEGVSAIIAQMDDRRALGVQQIELVNPPNFWEGIRHYGPKEVVDALSAILNQITAEDFGFIENGGSDAARDHAVEGWRIYDDILRDHPAALRN